jgi:hypothetical protein
VYFFLPCNPKTTPLEREKPASVLSDVDDDDDDDDDDDYAAAADNTNIIIIIIIIIIILAEHTWKAPFSEVQNAAIFAMHTNFAKY